MASTYTLISSNVLSSSAASVTFSSIPSTYTDLVLRYSGRQTGTSDVQDDIYLSINGAPSGTSYSETKLNGNGATATSNRNSNQPQWALEQGLDAGGNTANTFASGEIYIPNYTVSQNRVSSSFTANEDNATTAYLRARAHLYQNTTAITSLQLKVGSGQNFASGSSFYLYGVKNS